MAFSRHTPNYRLPNVRLNERLHMRHKKGRFLAVSIVVGALALSACGSDSDDGSDTNGSPASKDGTLTYADYGGDGQDAFMNTWVNPWAEEKGNVKVIPETTYDPAKMKAMVETGNVTWDVTGTTPTDQYSGEQVLEKIDCEVVDCESFVDGAPFDGYSAPTSQFATVLVYNTDKVKDAPAVGWEAYYDTETYPGKRGMYGYPTNAQFEGALLADGVAPEDLYPLDMDRAMAKMATIKDDVVVWQTGAQCVQLVADGEVTMADCWNSRVPAPLEEGAPIAIDWTACTTQFNMLSIVKGSKNVDLAMEMIAYITDPEINGKIVSAMPFGPGVKDAAVADDAKYKDDNPGAYDTCVPIDQIWAGQNGEELANRYNEWLTK
jgi:putative spermidine/putrescine transport system substrate-binding protein